MLGALTLWALMAAPALAQDGGMSTTAATDSRARELWENGAILYSEGRYEDAILAWNEAYRLSERPLILTNIANAQERLGLWREALETLNRYRAFAPADERDALDRRIANLERRLAEQVTPSTQPAAQPAPAPAPTATSRPGLGLPVALLVGGLAGGGVGATFGVLSLGAREDATALCVGSDDDLLCPSSAQDALDRDRRYAMVADVSYGTGLVLAAAGVALLVRARRGAPGVQACLAPVPGGGVVALTTGF